MQQGGPPDQPVDAAMKGHEGGTDEDAPDDEEGGRRVTIQKEKSNASRMAIAVSSVWKRR